MGGKIGQWAFIGGVVIALVLAFVPEWKGQLTLVLVALGLIVGLLNISEKETTPFLVAGIALLATGNATNSLSAIPPKVVGDYLVSAVGNISAFVAPAAVVVAVKAIFALSKD